MAIRNQADFINVCVDDICAHAERYRTEFRQQVGVIPLLYQLANVEQLYKLLSSALMTFQSNIFMDMRFFNIFFYDIPLCFSIGLQKEIQITLIIVGVLAVAVICICLCICLCPGFVPGFVLCCTECHVVLSRALDRVLSCLSELCRCCHGERKKIHEGTKQTQTELQEKEPKENCPRPVRYGSSVYSPDISKGSLV